MAGLLRLHAEHLSPTAAAEAVLGTRCERDSGPERPQRRESDIQAARAANNAALYIREQCATFKYRFSGWYFLSSISAHRSGASSGSMMATNTDGGMFLQLAEEQAGIGGRPNRAHSAARPGDGDTCPECGSGMDGGSYQPGADVSVRKDDTAAKADGEGES